VVHVKNDVELLPLKENLKANRVLEFFFFEKKILIKHTANCLQVAA
jgi:hypothetical protein